MSKFSSRMSLTCFLLCVRPKFLSGQYAFDRLIQFPNSASNVIGATRDADGKFVLAYMQANLINLIKTDSMGVLICQKKFDC